ncbi:MAG TPA: galactose oxidase-like domain-containing protein [Gemmatimonadales bacterium]|nr:galactose oxidase-like domain-containing protein [Gemmatimonadales bacterium]
MPSLVRLRAFLGMGTAVLAAVVLLHACSQEPSEITIEEAKAVRYQLTIWGGSSSASGTVTSNRGGISCSIAGSTGGASTSGGCSQNYKSGSVVSITATAATGSVLRLDQEWQGCTPNPEDRRVCQITMNGNIRVAPTFVPASNNFTLSVSGGGSGSVFSTPSGITCTITNGQSTGNCGAGFLTSTSVKLTATPASGNYLKAWAGGGCDASGTTGAGVGSCTTTVRSNLAIVVSFDAQATIASEGEWSAPITWPAGAAVAINAILLPNGKVMTYGRMSGVPVVWDPAGGGFTNLQEPADFFCSGHALLGDGRLLVAGGHSGTDNYGIRTSYVFDAVTNLWSRADSMRNGRWYPTSTTLPSGEVLTISGGDTAAKLNRVPEVYQPVTNKWRALTDSSRAIPYYPMMFVVPDGSVYYVGPEQTTQFLSTTGSGRWTTGPSRNCCSRDYGSAVMYDAGKILVVGGGNTPTKTAESIDLTGSATWGYVAPLNVARRQLNATLLADGKVLVTGGTDATGFNNAPLSSAALAPELWDPANPGAAWKKLASMSHHRLYHSTALLLPDARVLSAGSGQPAATGLSDDRTGEIFTPPYLYKPDGTLATRPVITSAPAAIGYGQTFLVETAEAASIGKVTFIRLSAVTHSFNQSQRMNVLSFSAGAGSVTVTAPSGPNMAPPGDYMLFVVNAAGVPSVAKIVRIG